MKKRSQKLVLPPVQLNLVASMAGLAVVAMMLQFLFLGARLIHRLREVQGLGSEVAGEVPGILVEVFLVSLGALLPMIVALGILVTFRIAGPIHAFHLYLDALARGEKVGPCRLRRGDKLQSLCDAINRATEPLRDKHSEAPEEAAESSDEPARAA